ncbi:MAG: lysylphosphatidylglycerol synthase domain-containing protein [Bacteroidota bacterium]
MPWIRPLLAVTIFLLIAGRLSGALEQDWWGAFLFYFSNSDRAYLLVLVMMLMPVNWLIESLKWKNCIYGLERISLWLSFKAVLTGVSVSLFMPNRIGEYAGRVFVLQEADRIKAALATVVAAWSQLLVTVVAGAIALAFYETGGVFSFADLPVASAISCMLLFMYFSSNRIGVLLSRLPLPLTWKHRLDALSMFTPRQLSVMLTYSIIRYAVFVFQFMLILHFFEVVINPMNAVIGIAVTYLVMSVVPTIALTELGIRGAVAVLIFTPYSGDVEQVVFASSMLWFINLILPAMVGSLFIIRWRFNRR